MTNKIVTMKTETTKTVTTKKIVITKKVTMKKTLTTKTTTTMKNMATQTAVTNLVGELDNYKCISYFPLLWLGNIECSVSFFFQSRHTETRNLRGLAANHFAWIVTAKSAINT